MIRIPVSGVAKQTAADMNSADRPAVDRYRLAQELKGMTLEQLATEIAPENEYQINGLDEGFARAVIVVSPIPPVTTMEIDYEIGFNKP